MNNQVYTGLSNNKEDFREYDIVLSSNPLLFIPVKLRRKYTIQCEWVDSAGSGTLTVNGSNSASPNVAEDNYWPIINESTGTDLILDIPDGAGEDFIRDYVGIVDRCLVLDFVNFTAGTMTITINFS